MLTAGHLCSDSFQTGPGANPKRRGIGDLGGVQFSRAAKRTFPDGQDSPACLSQSMASFGVVEPVFVNFTDPKVSVRLRNLEQLTAVAMPEATVNQHYRVVFRQDQIWFSRKASIIQLVPEPLGKKKLPHLQFRFSVRAANARHAKASTFGCKDIGHKWNRLIAR